MTSDPIKELSDLTEWSQTYSEEVLILPRVISSGPRETNERDEKGWFGYFIEAKAKCHSLAKVFWQTLTEWFDNWVRVVLTGCVIGLIIGVVYRWSLLPN